MPPTVILAPTVIPPTVILGPYPVILSGAKDLMLTCIVPVVSTTSFAGSALERSEELEMTVQAGRASVRTGHGS